MRRPLVWGGMSVLLAVLAASRSIWWCAIVFLVGLCGIATIEYYRNSECFCLINALRYICRQVIICFCIYVCAYLYGVNAFAPPIIDSLVDEYNMQYVYISGTVEKISVKEYGVVLVMSGCTANVRDISSQDLKVLVTLYDDIDVTQDMLYTEGFEGVYSIECGDYIELEGSIKRFSYTRNDGEFDRKAYYNSLGIRYQVYGCKISQYNKVSGFQAYINTYKSMFDEVYDTVSDEKEAGILKAVVLGDKDCIDDDVYELYQKNGIAHILAISGLHISFIGVAIYKLFKRILSGYIVPFMSAMTVLLLYTFMTGNGVSAKRAVVMCIVSMGADVLGRTYDVLSALSMSAVLIVVENVFIIYNTAFLLSFGAVIGIAVVYPAFKIMFTDPIDKKADRVDRKRQIAKRSVLKGIAALVGNLGGSISVSLVTLPIIMSQYYEVPVYSVFLNLLVIPVMSLLLICAILVALIGLFSIPVATFFMGTVHYILKFYTTLCVVTENMPGSIYVTGKPQLMDCIVYYVLLGVFVMLVTLKRQRGKKEAGGYRWIYSGIICVAIIILLPIQKRELCIRMLDVGQGECIYVQYNNKTFLFDGGSSDVYNVGRYRIYPCLRSNGVTCIDYIFVSHADTDHISGILELIDMQDSTFTIKNLVLPDIKDKESQEKYVKIVNLAKANGISVICVSTQDTYITADEGLKISCLHPYRDYNYVDSNDYSAVFRMEYGAFSMLITGDVGENAELSILEKNEKLNVDVLKVAHHGSKYSSCEEFISRTTPDIAIISCGEDNSYGHPHNETMARFQNYGTKIYITKECGQITLFVDDESSIDIFCKILNGKMYE